MKSTNYTTLDTLFAWEPIPLSQAQAPGVEIRPYDRVLYALHTQAHRPSTGDSWHYFGLFALVETVDTQQKQVNRDFREAFSASSPAGLATCFTEFFDGKRPMRTISRFTRTAPVSYKLPAHAPSFVLSFYGNEGVSEVHLYRELTAQEQHAFSKEVANFMKNKARRRS